MKLSERIVKIKPSPTLAVTALANAMKAKGIDVIGFGSGEPDFDTPDSIKNAAIKAIEKGKTKYTPAGGIPELKKAVIDKFKKENNLVYTMPEVTINSGGKHSYYNLMQVILNDGDEVIIPSPYWVSYPPIVELAGGIPVIIDGLEKNGFKITADELEKAITPRTKAVVINSPSNPTGAAYTKKELEDLAKVLLKYPEVSIISDDIYESIIYDNFVFTNLANLSEELKKRCFVLNAVSKTYAMTGWRIGYMAGDAKVMAAVETLQSQSTSNPTSIAQWAALEALEGDQSQIKVMVEAFDRRRKLIVESLNLIQGIHCTNPNGAFYAFPRISDLYSFKGWSKIAEKYEGEFNSSKFSSFLLEEARVAVVPGIAFGSDDYIRLSFATSDETITEGVKRIREAVKNLM